MNNKDLKKESVEDMVYITKRDYEKFLKLEKVFNRFLMAKRDYDSLYNLWLTIYSILSKNNKCSYFFYFK